MIHDASELQVGRIVYLYPHSKTASRNVQRLLAVSVSKDPLAHWPMVLVTWIEDGVERWEMVHRDNIRLRKPGTRVKSEERDGDTTQDSGGMSKWARVRTMPGKPLEIKLPPGVEQGELF